LKTEGIAERCEVEAEMGAVGRVGEERWCMSVGEEGVDLLIEDLLLLG